MRTIADRADPHFEEVPCKNLNQRRLAETITGDNAHQRKSIQQSVVASCQRKWSEFIFRSRKKTNVAGWLPVRFG